MATLELKEWPADRPKMGPSSQLYTRAEPKRTLLRSLKQRIRNARHLTIFFLLFYDETLQLSSSSSSLPIRFPQRVARNSSGRVGRRLLFFAFFLCTPKAPWLFIRSVSGLGQAKEMGDLFTHTPIAILCPF